MKTANLFLICSLLSLFLFSGCTAVKPETAAPAAGEKAILSVENFHKVSDELYRSAQPEEKEWKALAEFGIKSVINLRYFGRNTDKPGDTGIIVYSLPWRAENISENDLIELLHLIKNAPKPVLIHCYHGSDRTGAAVAAYRVVFQNWTPEAAAEELVNGGYGHHKYIYSNIPKLIRKADYQKIRSALR